MYNEEFHQRGNSPRYFILFLCYWLSLCSGVTAGPLLSPLIPDFVVIAGSRVKQQVLLSPFSDAVAKVVNQVLVLQLSLSSIQI